MSCVYLIAADKPLPLCDRREARTATIGKYTVTVPCGFFVMEHSYYRASVDLMALPMKPYQYEFQLEYNVRDLASLRAYLETQFSDGESVELWHLWVGNDDLTQPVRHQGTLSDFDMDTLKQFLATEQTCLTVTI